MQSGLRRDSHNHPMPQNIVIPISRYLWVADESGTVLLEGQRGRALEIDPPPEPRPILPTASAPPPQTAPSQTSQPKAPHSPPRR